MFENKYLDFANLSSIVEFAALDLLPCNLTICRFCSILDNSRHGLRTPSEEIALTVRQKSNPNPKFSGTAEAFFVCHNGPKFQLVIQHKSNLKIWADAADKICFCRT